MRYFGFKKRSFGLKTIGWAGSTASALADLFKNGEQGVWLDPSDLSTMFQDAGGLIPVTKDGDPVALIKDKSGNGNHATQTTASARPIYRTDGLLHWLEFDGVDDLLLLNESPISFKGTAFTVALGMDANILAAVNRRYLTLYTSPDDWFQLSTVSSELPIIASRTGDNINNVGGEKYNLAGFNVASVDRGGLYVGGAKRVMESGNSALGVRAANAIGSDGTLAVAKMSFYGLVIVSSEGMRPQIEGYLAKKSGVTL